MPTLSPKEIKVQEISELLRSKYAIFTGGHDREFRSLIIFPDYQMEHLPHESFTLLMQYLSTMNSMHASVHSFVILIDKRTSDWNSVKAIVSKLNVSFPATLEHIYVIKPQGFLQRFFVEKTMDWIREESHYPVTFVNKLEDLFPFIDSTHLPVDMGGQLLFSMENWLQDRAVVQNILERYFHGFSASSVPLQFEQFRDHVSSLCDQGRELLDQIRQPSSACHDSKLQVYQVNPSYIPSLMTSWKRRRRKLLDAIDRCEADGLRLRQTLRDRSQLDQTGSLNSTDATSWTHADGNFDLPVDRVFHVINLEHMLVKLAEGRSQFNQTWRRFTKRASIVKLMADIEQRFIELEPLVGLWGNLLESASDYYQCGRTGAVRQQPANLSMRQPSSTSSSRLPRSTSLDEAPSSLTAESANSSTDEMCLEDLKAIVDRLVEAEQFGSNLVPDLLALSKTATWVITYVREKDPHPDFEKSGIEALTRFTFSLDSESDPDEEDISARFHSDSSLTDPQFPTLSLPTSADRWVTLFDRLLGLARDELPKTADQLSRLAQLYSEMEKARSWIQRGTELIISHNQTVNFATWSLQQCHGRLDELTGFYESRKEGHLHALTDPKLYHSRYSGIVTADLRNTLMELLKQMEYVEKQFLTGITCLRQHISRTKFPRHQNTSQSLSSTSTPVSDSNSTSTSPDLHDTRNLDPDSSRPSPTRSNPNGFVRSKSSDAVASPVNRFRLAWEELVETERTYVTFLQSVYDVFWRQGEHTESGPTDSSTSNTAPAASTTAHTVAGTDALAPAFMRDNQGLLLVNWPELLYFHRDYLLPALENANRNGIKLNQWACQMAPRMIDLYSVYCSLHGSAVQVAVQLERDRIYTNWISACNEQVYKREQAVSASSPNPSLDSTDSVRPVLRFSSRLVTPVQRFQRYHLLMDRLLLLALTEADKQDLSSAHQTMLQVCETVNLTMRFRGLSIRPSELGRLLLHADFTVSRGDTRASSSQQRHVFLFTNAMLLTKFRSSAVCNTPVLNSSSILSLGSDFTVDGKERTGSNSALTGSFAHPLVSNLANLTKAHILMGSGGGSASTSAAGSNESGPVYEIRQELLLAQIGLTPSVRADRRRFAIWTANRAQTYVFHTTDSATRDRWVHSINDLLMAQLRRLRDEALQHHGSNTVVHSAADKKARASSQMDRSSTLPSPSTLHFPKDCSANTSVRSLPGASQPQRKVNQKTPNQESKKKVR